MIIPVRAKNNISTNDSKIMMKIEIVHDYRSNSLEERNGFHLIVQMS